MTKETSERNWVILWAVAIVLLASIPYLWGIYIAVPGYSFLGLTHNIGGSGGTGVVHILARGD